MNKNKIIYGDKPMQNSVIMGENKNGTKIMIKINSTNFLYDVEQEKFEKLELPKTDAKIIHLKYFKIKNI